MFGDYLAVLMIEKKWINKTKYTENQLLKKTGEIMRQKIFKLVCLHGLKLMTLQMKPLSHLSQ